MAWKPIGRKAFVKIIKRDLRFRKKDRVLIKATGESGSIVMADNVRNNHLVLLHDTQRKKTYRTDEMEKIG